VHWISGAASGTLSGVPIDDAVLTAALAETGVDHGPGLFGLVTEHGEVVFEGSVGVADLARPRPIAARDRFRIASVTKTYVAALVMQLIAEGRLSLDDSVQQRLPGLVPDSSEITVELLLRMRSGLPDWVGPVFGDPPDIRVLDRYWAPTELIRLALTADGRVAPGTGYRYCNTDYALLGLMIEKVTGQSVEAQLWQRIFQPLHLDDTSFPTVEPQIRGPHASGHLRDRPGARYDECTTLSPSEGWTAGAIVATPTDVARFLDGLLDGKVVDPDGLRLMMDCRETINADTSRGLGLVRYDFGGGRVAFGHQGATPGFSTVAMRTTTGRSIVLYQNGLDAHDQLPARAPFMTAAMTM